MSKTEKVRIELPPVKCGIPPVKECKINNKRPTTNKFKLIPKYIPFLSQFVETVSWDCAGQTIDITISETDRFEAYKWFGGINKRMAESQKSSFVDLEQDSLLLVFVDENDKEVTSVKFRGLCLVEHECYLAKDYPVENLLVHSVKLQYSDCETVPIFHDEFGLVTPSQRNEIVDNEWQADQYVEVS
jgi:hypothetical protein